MWKRWNILICVSIAYHYSTTWWFFLHFLDFTFKMNYLNQFYLLIYLNCTFSIYFSLQCGVPFTEQFAQMSHISVNQFSASVLSIICTPIASVYYSSTTRACWKYISDFSEKKKDPRPFHESWINQNLPGSIITISNVNYDGVMRDERLCDITWKSYCIYHY